MLTTSSERFTPNRLAAICLVSSEASPNLLSKESTRSTAALDSGDDATALGLDADLCFLAAGFLTSAAEGSLTVGSATVSGSGSGSGTGTGAGDSGSLLTPALNGLLNLSNRSTIGKIPPNYVQRTRHRYIRRPLTQQGTTQADQERQRNRTREMNTHEQKAETLRTSEWNRLIDDTNLTQVTISADHDTPLCHKTRRRNVEIATIIKAAPYGK